MFWKVILPCRCRASWSALRSTSSRSGRSSCSAWCFSTSEANFPVTVGMLKLNSDRYMAVFNLPAAGLVISQIPDRHPVPPALPQDFVRATSSARSKAECLPVIQIEGFSGAWLKSRSSTWESDTAAHGRDPRPRSEDRRRRIRRPGRAIGLRQDDNIADDGGPRDDFLTARSRSAAATSQCSRRRSRDIAMVFQSYALFPHMTVRDKSTSGSGSVARPTERNARRR